VSTTITIPGENPSGDPTTPEHAASLQSLAEHVTAHGFATYRFDNRDASDPEAAHLNVINLARSLQLVRHDRGVLVEHESLSVLQDHTGAPLGRFRPYSNQILNWHTDGYYNQVDEPVRTFVLHCIHPAHQGGELTMLDPELLLIELYQRDPSIVSTLAQPDALTLPGNVDAEGHSRPDRHVPVFYSHQDGSLGMRFTTRQTNINFKSPKVEQAMSEINEAIESCSQWHAQVRLQANDGLIARNLLHTRSTFSDMQGQPPRTILRGRFLDKLQLGA